jgi:hypothetical protein
MSTTVYPLHVNDGLPLSLLNGLSYLPLVKLELWMSGLSPPYQRRFIPLLSNGLYSLYYSITLYPETLAIPLTEPLTDKTLVIKHLLL